MKITSYTDIGKRENNEDFIACNDFVFTLCDGVGGNAKGEVASRFLAESIIQKTQGINRSLFSVEWAQKIIFEVQDDLNKSLVDNPEYWGMGTTLCAVFIGHREVLLAHIGDSRIYVVKPCERKYWHSIDHSTVAELLQSGLITEKEAINHSRRNEITRAVQVIPELEASQADISILTETKPGDLIFMCSDGVLEAFRDSELVDILCHPTLDTHNKLELIKRKCLAVSSDNHSAILLEFENEDLIKSFAEDHLNWIYLPATNDSVTHWMAKDQSKFREEEKSDMEQQRNKRGKIIKVTLYMMAILFITFLTLTMLKK